MAKGGFGGGSWGGGSWGGSSGANPPQIVYETVTFSESLDVLVPLLVTNAQALNAFLVEVTFSHNLDYGYAPVLSTGNYSSDQGLTILGVSIGPTSNTVRLVTSEQGPLTYNLTVGDGRSAPGDPLTPPNQGFAFPGFPIAPRFFAAAQSRTKVQLVFSTEMLQNTEFSDIASYSVTDLGGTPIAIASATIFGPTPVQRLTLELAADMDPGGYYVVTILDPAVQTTRALPIYPDNDLFQWAEAAAFVDGNPLNIAFDQFSGEVSGGLLGRPLGQVFFSPALEASAADSSIQIDEVSVCTRAYDVYTIPSLPDPEPFATFGGPTTTTIGDHVLWAPAERLGLARINLTDLREEAMPTTVDGPADATLIETVDANRAAFLNVPGYTLFPGAANSVNSLLLDGVGEYITVGNVVPLQLDWTDAFSLVVWFKTISGATLTLMGKREDGGTDRGYQFLLDGGFLRALLVNTGGSDEIDVVSDNLFDDGLWHQAVLTYSGGGAAANVTLYIDGLPLSVTVNDDSLTGTTLDAVPFHFGARGTVPTDFFDGNLDDGAVYDKELSAGEITTIYAGGDPPDLTSVGPTGNLVGYWKMGDGATFPTIPDDSINANDGTMSGGMVAGDIKPAASGVFITADNLAPLGSGPTAIISLQP